MTLTAGGWGEVAQVRDDAARESADSTEARARLGRVIVRGSKLTDAITSRITSAELSWSTEAVTQLALTFTDPELLLWKRALFERGTPMVYREPGRADLELRVRALDLDGGPTGTGGFTVMARSAGVQALKRRTGVKIMRKASPTDFVKAECRAVGLKVVAQKSEQRKQVARDVARKGEEDLKGSDRPSSWTTFGRLASELGFWVYEFGNTVYFGKPTWLLERDEKPMRVTLPLEDAAARTSARSIPSIAMSEDAAVPVVISDLQIERARLAECSPGQGVIIDGLPPFDEPYLITSLNMQLIGVNEPLTLNASTPVNPKPQPPARPAKTTTVASTTVAALPGLPAATTTPGAATQPGSRSAYDFVTMAISASNASYVYGGEASIADPTPAVLDCSELVEWALGRIGITFGGTAASMIGASRPVSVATGLRTRGALLYSSYGGSGSHIGISLGDGRSMEARNPRAGVGIFRAADVPWERAGLVPALRYG